jgi:hypothetical protein
VGFRTGVLIGVLATAVVALGVAVVILANDSGDSGGGATSTTTSSVVGPPCKLETARDRVEFELSSEAVGCSEARGIYAQFKEMVRAGEAAGIEQASEVGGGWSCEEFPFSEWPLRLRCTRGEDKFAAVGLGPGPHANGGPRPPKPENNELVSFQSPSGNIGCIMDAEGVRCDIRERHWSPPPKPKDCPLDWGQGIRLEDDGAAFVCAGDTALSPTGGNGVFPVLDYGEHVQLGKSFCFSSENGMTCERGRHGFFLSVQEVKIF